MLLDPVGGIVVTPLVTTGSRNTRGRTGGGSVVLWLTVTVVGFLMATALVIALARGSTVRWERAKRAARAPLREAAAPPAPPTRAGAQLRGAVVRTGAAVLRIAAPGGRPMRAVIGVVGRARKQVLSRVRPLPQALVAVRSVVHGVRRCSTRWTQTGAPDLPVDERVVGEGGADAVLGPEPELTPAAPPVPQRSERLYRRRALRLIHRHDRGSDPRVLHQDNQESSTAG